MNKKIAAWLMLGGVALLAGCAHSPPDEPQDPLEPVNRVVFKFNTKADKYVLRPVARGYVDVVPEVFRRGLTNFFSNLFYPKVIVNDLLQAKFLQSGSDLARFLLNSTAGIGGFLDVASDADLPAHDEDFGQTLGYWGLGPGWYLMLPLLGPSDNRDLVGTAVDSPLNPMFYVNDLAVTLPVGAVNIVNVRANLLGGERLLESQFDPYIFVRTAYLQHRESLVYDGNPPEESLLPADDSSSPAPASPASTPPTNPR